MKTDPTKLVAGTQRTLPARQKLLLQLLAALGGSVGNLDFQKLLFLYCQELRDGAPYDFVPYKFGAFSFTSYADRRKLVEQGLLCDDEKIWTLTDAGRALTGTTADVHLASFARRHGELRGTRLIALTYRRFPFFAIRSQVVDDVLKDDPESLARVNVLRARPDSPAMFTIGYEGHSPESYLSTLIRNGVTLLCDVRRNPLSRKYGFSKSALARTCDGIGIRYEHIPELGIASDQRRELSTQADYDALFAEYMQDWLPDQGPALTRIREWFDAGERVALTCYEHLPAQCHRHCVSDELATRFGQDMVARHL